MSIILSLFLSMVKIGCFAFGGGYAIIALFENEFVSKRKLIEHDDFMDIVAIVENTPGSISINVATCIGYRLKGFWGAFVSMIGVCVPSFVIMYFVSLFYNEFMEIAIVAAAFKGIQVCVVYLITSAGIKMLKKMRKSAFNIIAFSVTCIGMILCTVFDVHIPAVWFILSAGLCGLVVSFFNTKKQKGEQK